jgi:hypothetical protein
MNRRNDPSLPGPPLSTPLIWAAGGVLLALTFWLTGLIALFRAFAELIG